MANELSMNRRALMAVGLMVGFYLLALSLAAALLYIPYAEWVYTGRLHLRISVFSIIGALVILWSIIPRIDKFIPPGPRVDSTTQPGLFEQISDIAHKAKQEMPAEVF